MNFVYKFSGESVKLKTYEGNAEGFIESYVDRFTSSKAMAALEHIWTEDKKLFPKLLEDLEAN